MQGMCGSMETYLQMRGAAFRPAERGALGARRSAPYILVAPPRRRRCQAYPSLPGEPFALRSIFPARLSFSFSAATSRSRAFLSSSRLFPNSASR